MSDPQVKYSLEHLSTFIAVTMHLTGKKPEKIELVPDFYAWYVQEVNRMADILGLQLGFKDGKPTYNGIPVEKKE